MPSLRSTVFYCLLISVPFIGLAESSVKCYKCDKKYYEHGDTENKPHCSSEDVVECEGDTVVCMSALYMVDNYERFLTKGCSIPHTICPHREGEKTIKCDVCSRDYCNYSNRISQNEHLLYLTAVFIVSKYICLG